MYKKKGILAALCSVLLLSGAISAYAFSDIGKDPAEKEIRALQQKGVVVGVGNNNYAPRAELTYAAGIQLIVKGLGLNINAHLTKKELKPSSFFSKVKDDVWYSRAFVIAQMNGLDLPKDIEPNKALTKEQFAHLLFQAVETTGDYAFTKQWIVIKDEENIDPAYMHSIQLLLIGGMAELQQDQNFNPKQTILRSEAAKLLFNAMAFVRERSEAEGPSGVKPPSTMTLTYHFPEATQTEEAAYWEGQKGYYIYIPDRFTTSSDAKTGIDSIVSVEVPWSTMTIAVLPSDSDIDKQKQLALKELKTVYPGIEPVISKADAGPFFEKAYYQIIATDGKTTTEVYLIPHGGKLYSISMHAWKSEL
ncbi:MAG: S-layer homology domain-containing protein, partial [Gorillibacterium sp.]|nr:S-layer homology domain-containing protein [Gorillibacterium sp.]